ncbi:MAG: S1 RNA-binding domain-containing protein [Thermodesulfobacteriota bacterium]
MEENNTQHEKEKSFEELLDENLDIKKDEEKTKLVKGTIVRIDKDVVFVDFGFKSEGIIPIEEFKEKNTENEIEIGSEVEVVLEKSNSGIPKVSKKKADLFKEKDYIDSSFKDNKPIAAIPTSKIKGGYICDIGDKVQIQAFLPHSQVNLHPDSEDIIGQQIHARIIQNDNNGLVISRRILLEEEREIKKKETLSRLTEGAILTGVVIKIIDKGAFVDLSGITGYLPIGEISWGRIKNPSDVISEKQSLELKILKIEDETNRITLSLKHMTIDPWENIEEKYPKGTRVNGRVVSTKEFGVFVELEPGIEGLVHVSELSWTKSFRHPKEIVETDSPVDVIVIETKKEEKKLSLSLRQIEPSPWQVFRDNNKMGTVVTGTIKNINEHGLFVEVAENLVGLVRPENISWQGKVNPTDFYNKDQIGQEIDVSLLHIDTKNQKIALGIKQLNDDPWEIARKKYKQGETTLIGKIKDIKPYGLIVELENELEGFYKNSELGLTDKEQEKYKIGEELTGLVTGFEKNKRQVNLSIKRLEKKHERDRVSEFISSQGENSSKLGDILGEKLKSLDN